MDTSPFVEKMHSFSDAEDRLLIYSLNKILALALSPASVSM